MKDLGRLVPELRAPGRAAGGGGGEPVPDLRFDAGGAIKAAFVFLKMDAALAAMAAETLALAQAVQTVFCGRTGRSTDFAAGAGGGAGDPAAGDRGGDPGRYDPVMPAVARDPSHALRLAARVSTWTIDGSSMIAMVRRGR